MPKDGNPNQQFINMTTITSTTAANMEDITLSKNASQNLSTALHTYGKDSGISGSSVCIDEKGASSGSITSSSSNDETHEAGKITFMVHFSETECHATLLHENGEIVPFRTKGSTGNYSIPFKMGIVREKVVVFGEEALSYENAKIQKPEFWKKRYTTYNLWEQLLDQSEVIKIFYYDDKPVHANIELMLGLYLCHLKDMIENYLNCASDSKIHQISKAVILVPIWYKSLHRQRLKDAARIGGFSESYIVNETSALALIHVAARKLHPGTPINLLIFSQNSGSTDLTFYCCEADNFVNMLATTGNRTSSWENINSGYAHSRNVDKVNYEEIIKNGNHRKNDFLFKKYFFLRLLEDIRDALPFGINSVQFVDCVILSHSDESDWRIVMQQVLNRSVITHYKHVGAPPVGIPKQYWLPPNIPLESFVGPEKSKISDIFPIKLQQTMTLTLSGEKSLKIKGEVKKDINGTLTAYPMGDSVFHQEDISGVSWKVGTLKVKPILYFDHDYPVIETSLRQSREGIFRLQSVIARNASCNSMKMLTEETEDYSWRPCNLKTRKIEECTQKLREMLDCSERYTEERSQVIEELWTICGDISEKLFNGEHGRRLGGKRERKMDDEVNATLRMLKDISVNNLMEVGKERLTKKLREWRREYRNYFEKCMIHESSLIQSTN